MVRNNRGKNKKKYDLFNDDLYKDHPLLNNRILAVFAVAIVLIIYLPVFENEFVGYDDKLYVTENPNLPLTTKNLVTSFTEGEHHGLYAPLTALSLSLNHHFHGFDPSGYHFVNLALHLLNTILVFAFVFLLFRSRWLALAAALLFGLHPMQVESVAFIAGRRDVLFALFFILALYFYALFAKKKKSLYYILALISFVFSLLSKGQAVTLAISLPLIDYLLQRRLLSRKIILEKVPFLILAVAFGVIAIMASQGRTVGLGVDFPDKPFLQQFLFACYAYVQYIFKLLIPAQLSLYHPYPDETGDSVSGLVYLSPFIVLGIMLLVIYLARRNRTVAFGLMFFSFNIIHMLQIIPNSIALVNEHYVYVASIGVFIAMGYVFARYVFGSGKPRWLPAFVFLVYLVFLSATTHNRIGVFENKLTVWSDVIEKYPDHYFAYNGRGLAYMNQGRNAEALEDFTRSIKLYPDYFKPYINRAIILEKAGQTQQALQNYNHALKLNPGEPLAYSNRGVLKARLGDHQGAVQDQTMAIQLNPQYTDAYINRGFALSLMEEYDRAFADYSKAIAMKPENPSAYLMRGLTLTNMGQPEKAISDFNQSISLNVQDPRVYLYRAEAFETLNQFDKAVEDYSALIRFYPQQAELYYRRGVNMLSLGQTGKACMDLLKAKNMGYKEAGEAYGENCE